MVQVEAISRGLPVISTVNSAQVVENEISGYVLEVGDVDAVICSIRKYCDDRDLLLKHSIAAYERSAIFARPCYNKIISDLFAN